MKRGLAWLFAVVLAVGFCACTQSKQSAVEGKLVDANGKPVAGVKITASQVQPIKGYEQAEAVTGSDDGAFRLKGLFPSSEYVLKPWSDKWTTEISMTVETAPHGETSMLAKPMVIAVAYFKKGGALVFDLSKQSAVEGKLVDANGKPVAGVKVTASQVQPIKGYEQADAVTGADGAFRLKGLFPSSKYVLKPWSDKWTTEVSMTVETAPHGETSMLPKPMVIARAISKKGGGLVLDLATGATRFAVSPEGVIRDSQTGLEWIVGSDRDTNYAQAEQWVAGCNVAGGGWRMPTRQQLRTLYQGGIGKRNMDPSFKTTGWDVWAKTSVSEDKTAWFFDFGRGDDTYRYQSFSDGWRAFGVRSRPR